MKVGILQIFQNYEGHVDDADVVNGELRLGVLAEEVGFSASTRSTHELARQPPCVAATFDQTAS